MNGQFVSSLFNCKADLRPILLFLVLNINHPHHFTASTEMRIQFGAIISNYHNREFNSDEISTRLQPTAGLTEFTRLLCGRNLATDGADFAVRKITLKSPNKPLDQALSKGLSLQESTEIIQLIKHLPTLFNLSHLLEGYVP